MSLDNPTLQPYRQPILTVGVVADTHVPDRVNGLHPNLVASLKAAEVGLILHAGDISIPEVLAELEQVAPVKAVRGNRDWAFGSRLALVEKMELAGVPVALMHGHGGWRNYLIEKIHYLFSGYNLERIKPLLLKAYPEVKVVIFGHTHHAECVWSAGKLLFNPGSVIYGFPLDLPPSFGLLRFFKDGAVEGEIVPLTGAKLIKGKWFEY